MPSVAPPLNVALLGCGAVAQLYYAPALAELERHAIVKVAAVLDPDTDSVAHVQRTLPRAVRVVRVGDLPALGVGLAIVASPPRFHAAQTLELLAAGVAVLCEKPMATTVAEGEAMIEAARQARRPLAVGLFRRFFPATQTIRDVLARGVLGDIQSFHCFEGGPLHWPARSAAFFQKAGLQGGVLLDIGIHLLDLLLWWWGPPTRVVYEDDALGGIEANCRLQVTFAPGFTGEVRLSRDWALPNRYVIKGTKGWLSWQVNDAEHLAMGFAQTGFALRGHLHQSTCVNAMPTLGSPAWSFEQSFVRQLCNVIGAVQGTEELVVSGEQALHSLQIVEHCYQHRTTMAMPWLHFPPTPAMTTLEGGAL